MIAVPTYPNISQLFILNYFMMPEVNRLYVIASTLSDSQGVFNFYRIWIFSSLK